MIREKGVKTVGDDKREGSKSSEGVDDKSEVNKNKGW